MGKESSSPIVCQQPLGLADNVVELAILRRLDDEAELCPAHANRTFEVVRDDHGLHRVGAVFVDSNLGASTDMRVDARSERHFHVWFVHLSLLGVPSIGYPSESSLAYLRTGVKGVVVPRRNCTMFE